MKKGFLFLILITAIFNLCSAEELNVYVSPAGNDNNNGTIEKPVASIQKARELIRERKEKKIACPVIVNLREGTYFLEETLTFTDEDSYTVYRSYAGEAAVISGGQKITGFEHVAGNLWKTTIDKVKEGNWWFRQLWFDGKRCIRSRWPDPDEKKLVTEDFTDDYKTVRFDRKIKGDEFKKNNTELVYYNFWTVSRSKIKSTYGNYVTAQYTVGNPGSIYSRPWKTKPAYLEHNEDYIDMPFEWYLDKDTGELLIQMPANVNPNEHKIYAPKLDLLMSITGKEEKPVRNLSFKHIIFKHSKFNLPEKGYAPSQAGFYKTSDLKKLYYVQPAIHFESAENCSFENCKIINTGGTGIAISRKCNNNKIVNCEFKDIGGTGIYNGLVGNKKGITGLYKSNDAPMNNAIENNRFERIAKEWFGCVGIWDGRAKFTQIINNTITETSYTGISAGWRWDNTPYVQEGVNIENNYIYDVVRELDDGGGIYTLGYHKGGNIHNNLIHDVVAGWRAHHEYQNIGIYMDQGSSALDLRNNITYDVVGHDMTMKPSDEGGIMIFTDKEGVNSWGMNYFDVDPNNPIFQQHIAIRAGIKIKEAKVSVNYSDNGENIIISGKTHPWAKIYDVEIYPSRQVLTDHVTLTENGYFSGKFPTEKIKGEKFKIKIKFKDPEDRNLKVVYSNELEK